MSTDNLSDESLVEWASSWVHDEPPGQRDRFVKALREELARRAATLPITIGEDK